MIMKSLKLKLATMAGVFAMALTAGVANAADVAMLLPENVNPRWESQDAASFVATMEKIAPEITVEVYNANNDTATQQRQAEQAITKGAKVLVVIPIDGESSAVIADDAKEAGVPTIAYDRMINSKNTTFWVQADLEGMGYDQAMHVIENTKDGDTLVMLKGSPTDPNAAVIHNGQLRALTPLYESGKRVMGYENWTQGWDPAIARRSMDQALTKLNNDVQGVVSSNDGNAGAAIAAMEEVGLAGRVPVSGLDCTVAAQQLILLGKQTQCGWRPLADMAATTAEISAKIVKGENWKDLAPNTVKNGVGADVNFVSVASYSAVGPEGVAYVIENDTSISKADVCKGPAAATRFCKN